VTSVPYLACELLVLYVGVPAAIQAGVLSRLPILILLVAACACTAALVRDPTFDGARLWNAAGATAHAGGVLAELAVLSALLVAVTMWLAPDHLFDLVRTRPRLWAIVLLVYPLLSVYPQEIVYRAFFAHRYAPLLPLEAGRVVASAALFAFGHVFFPRPWIAMSLTFFGGLLFAYRYEESHSLLLVSIEHAVFGQLLFTIGLGRYFYAAPWPPPARVGEGLRCAR
jgi:membrane protease YdiL (CAAX protease family)